MQRILFILIFFNLCIFCSAQPAKRRTQPAVPANTVPKTTPATPEKPATTNAASPAPAKRAATTTTEKKADRAALMFPTSAQMPEDVVWRRDIYRQLDLLKDANAPLYYPVEPHGKEQNLFTYLFRLFVSGRISAYEYKLSGDESFEPADKAKVKELLEKFRIYYEENDGKITVPAADSPSAEVTRY